MWLSRVEFKSKKLTFVIASVILPKDDFYKSLEVKS